MQGMDMVPTGLDVTPQLHSRHFCAKQVKHQQAVKKPQDVTALTNPEAPSATPKICLIPPEKPHELAKSGIVKPRNPGGRGSHVWKSASLLHRACPAPVCSGPDRLDLLVISPHCLTDTDTDIYGPSIMLDAYHHRVVHRPASGPSAQAICVPEVELRRPVVLADGPS
ncbi:hypothetical protein VTI74DRAFT_2249 [Chaetomium olivicolor]